MEPNIQVSTSLSSSLKSVTIFIKGSYRFITIYHRYYMSTFELLERFNLYPS